VRSTAITYVNPAVAVFAGVLFLSEKLTIWKVLGLALVLGGSALATRQRRIPAASKPESIGAILSPDLLERATKRPQSAARLTQQDPP
ncbi:MAG: EamA family transporter, partial [Demequinaceae bacterium]|nr:EamA family transporter [Demequinaceae bacterium]